MGVRYSQSDMRDRDRRARARKTVDQRLGESLPNRHILSSTHTHIRPSHVIQVQVNRERERDSSSTNKYGRTAKAYQRHKRCRQSHWNRIATTTPTIIISTIIISTIIIIYRYYHHCHDG